MRPLLAVALLLLPAAGAAEEEAPLPKPRLIAVGSVDDLSDGPTGGQASLDAVVPTRGGRTWIAGVEGRSIDAYHWVIGKAGVIQRLGDRWHLHGTLQLGPGARDGFDDFLYATVEAGAGRRLGERFLAEASYLFQDVDTTESHLAKAALSWWPLPAWTLRLDGAHDLGGTLETRALALRSDAQLGRLRLTTGGAVGWSRADLPGLPVASRPDTERYEQLYAGTTIGVGAVDVGLWFERLWVAGTWRNTGRVVIEVPLARFGEDGE